MIKGSATHTNGSGTGRPKNIRIRIRNTGYIGTYDRVRRQHTVLKCCYITFTAPRYLHCIYIVNFLHVDARYFSGCFDFCGLFSSVFSPFLVLSHFIQCTYEYNCENMMFLPQDISAP